MKSGLFQRVISAGIRRAPIGMEHRLELVRRLEQQLQLEQGKGWGSHTPEEEVRSIVSLLPVSGATVLDVGANRGEWTRSLLRMVPERVRRVFAFEPAPENLSALADLRPPRVTVINAAVGRAPGEAILYTDAPGSGLASLHQRRLDHFGLAHLPSGRTRVVSLDGFADEAGIGTIDFMKMDIEGHEIAALEGAHTLLNARRIRALSFEFGGCNIDSRTYFQDFWYLLNGLGFEIFRIVPGAKLLPIRAYSEDLEVFRTTNYVAALGDG